MRIDGATWLVYALLIMGALFGFGALFGGIALFVSAWRADHAFKREQDQELKAEQAMAVAVAGASIVQDFKDRYPFYRALYAQIAESNHHGSRPGSCI